MTNSWEQLGPRALSPKSALSLGKAGLSKNKHMMHFPIQRNVLYEGNPKSAL